MPQELSKAISRFMPLDPARVAEHDEHYEQVHTRYIRELYADVPEMVAYHQDRVLAQHDLAGGWEPPSGAWRFVVSRYRAGVQAAGPMPAHIRRRVEADHRTFMRGLRTCAVRETTLLDRRSGQTALQKYVIELDRAPGVDAAAASAVVARAADALRDATGARLVLANEVLAERASRPLDEPGQGLPGEALPATDKLAFLELYFDHADWGRAFFASCRTVVDELCWDETIARGAVYEVEERCGIDRR